MAASSEADVAAQLIERLLADPAFRARFRRDPAGACREAGLDELAQEMSVAGGKAMMTLDIRESKSSLAGVMMAAAMEGVGDLPVHREPAAAPRGDPGPGRRRALARSTCRRSRTRSRSRRAAATRRRPPRPRRRRRLRRTRTAPPAAPPPPPRRRLRPRPTPKARGEGRRGEGRRAAAAAGGGQAGQGRGGPAKEAAAKIAEEDSPEAASEGGRRRRPRPRSTSSTTGLPESSDLPTGAAAAALPEAPPAERAAARRRPRHALPERAARPNALPEAPPRGRARPPRRRRETPPPRPPPPVQRRPSPRCPRSSGRAINPAQFGGEEVGTGGAPDPEALALLNNKNVVLDDVGIADIKAGRIDPRVVAVLTKLSQEHKIKVSCMCSDHSKMTAGGSISNHFYGRGLDIAAIDGEIVEPGQHARARGRERALVAGPELPPERDRLAVGDLRARLLHRRRAPGPPAHRLQGADHRGLEAARGCRRRGHAGRRRGAPAAAARSRRRAGGRPGRGRRAGRAGGGRAAAASRRSRSCS